MAYTKFIFNIPCNQETGLADILIAELDNVGFSGFEEGEEILTAYIDNTLIETDNINELAQRYGITYKQEPVEEKNWNEEWEKDFKPVIVGDFCTVRAHFHEMPVHTQHEVVITPKMSFGTGHHATTRLMIKHMEHIGFAGTSVLDFGTGTGVLAIVAEKLGAANILAIDNDEWSVNNTLENIERNGCSRISVEQGSLENVKKASFNVILANINRNILLQYMQPMYSLLNEGGTLLMSGLLTEDKSIVTDAAVAAGFALTGSDELNNWITLLCKK